jgi:hypothetical protein
MEAAWTGVAKEKSLTKTLVLFPIKKVLPNGQAKKGGNFVGLG